MGNPPIKTGLTGGPWLSDRHHQRCGPRAYTYRDEPRFKRFR